MVLHILIVKRVSIFLCSAWENKYFDISSYLTTDGIFRHTDDNAMQAFQANVMVSLALLSYYHETQDES